MSTQSNLTSGFIDLATYDELEKYMYGGSDAIAYFVRETRKATWFTQVPVQLAKSEGVADFGQNWSVSISRSGDYLLGTWLHVSLPAVSVAGYHARSICISWTPNLMHALIKNCSVSFNDLVAARFDGTHLDFWAAFTTPTSKAEGYRQMIGSQIPSSGGFIPAQTCDVPLPFFFARDSGLALPTAALPYNEMKISFSFRPWNELIVGFAPKIDCFQYGVTEKPTSQGGADAPYIIPAFNTNTEGIQPCWTSGIWPSCVPMKDAPADVDGNAVLRPCHPAEALERSNFMQSMEMSYIILPKLPGPPESEFALTGIHQVAQSADKNNQTIANTIPYYIGEPVNKNADGVFCDIKELSLQCQVWANYAIVSNEERKKMSCAPRDMLIEQVQTTPDVDFFIRNVPDSRWWPNNIDKEGDDGPDNKTTKLEDMLNNADKIAQKPSGQGYCINKPNLPTNPREWKVGNWDNSRHGAVQENSKATVSMNLKYAHSVKVLFFAVKNTTACNIHSNYTIGFPVMQTAMTDQVTLDGPVFDKKTWNEWIDKIDDTDDWIAKSNKTGDHDQGGINKYVGKIQCVNHSIMTCKNGFDPIEKVSMLYETTPRLGLLDSSYYSLIQPYYHAPGIPTSFSPVFCPSGYHMYSYSLEFMSLDPLGSTNYGKLTNVSLQAEPIKLNASNLCPELVYQVPLVDNSESVNPKYLYGPINGPGIAGSDASVLKNQPVIEVLINLAYQNIYSEMGLKTISPWTTVSNNYIQSSQCSFFGQFKFVSSCINNNILRISGGSIGFPIL